ncbi:hypothetical protein BMT54_00695 [Pasteurellaceae bacterium 15-036681]|nr:hypothetical protein BMT54_00695 [Pasteurellaceae bacterium 15-036681]
MKIELLKKWANEISQKYQIIENYFTKGSFGVKFYPLLMYPCVRISHILSIKLIATLSIFLGLYYIFAELITILFSNTSLIKAYLGHSTLELLMPLGTIIDNQTINMSPLSFTMRAIFFIQGCTFVIIYLLGATQLSSRFRVLGVLSALLFSCGMIIISSTQGGKFTDGGLQNLGASITFILGNLTMIFAGLGVKSEKFKSFRIFSILGGLIGTTTILVTLFLDATYLPILERISLYAIMLWEIRLGFNILKQVR